MSWLASLVLRLIHVLYSLVISVSYVRGYFRSAPQPLAARRNKIPTSLAIVLTCAEDYLDSHNLEESFIQCVERAAAWCRVAGIGRLTVYDRQGILTRSSKTVQDRLCPPSADTDDEESEPDIVYPITPPLSDDSDSQITQLDDCLDEDMKVVTIHPSGSNLEKRRRLSRSRTGIKRRQSHRKDLNTLAKPLTLQLVSRDSGKPAIAAVASSIRQSGLQTSYIKSTKADGSSLFQLSVNDLQCILEGTHGLCSPDLLIIHHVTPVERQKLPLELYGFPPWQVRLTEIYHNGYRSPQWRWPWASKDRLRSSCVLLNEVEFRKALDEFAGAEIRLGK